MASKYLGILLYLVPVAVAAFVAYVVTRPAKDETDELPKAKVLRLGAPNRRASDRRGRRSPAPVVNHPTLMHAALSTHLTAVTRPVPKPAATAARAAEVAARHIAPLVSIRKPARIPRRPSHRCPHKPE
jgi:hypothetical protein